MEDSWTSLIGGLLAASRALSARARNESEPRIFKESGDEDDEDDHRSDDEGGSEGTESSSHSSHKNQTFDRHLVLVGCQTFQVLYQALFLSTWLGTHTSTMSRDVPDIHGDQADFCSGDCGDVIIYHWFVFEGKRDFWLFGRPQPFKKPKQSKGPFFRENEPLK